MSAERWFGDSAVMVADEVPEMGVLSPQTIGGTSTVLHLHTEDMDIRWKHAVDAGAVVMHRCRTCSGAPLAAPQTGHPAAVPAPPPAIPHQETHQEAEEEAAHNHQGRLTGPARRPYPPTSVNGQPSVPAGLL
jgi:hypothetical protein